MANLTRFSRRLIGNVNYVKLGWNPIASSERLVALIRKGTSALRIIKNRLWLQNFDNGNGFRGKNVMIKVDYAVLVFWFLNSRSLWLITPESFPVEENNYSTLTKVSWAWEFIIFPCLWWYSYTIIFVYFQLIIAIFTFDIVCKDTEKSTILSWWPVLRHRPTNVLLAR